ncbi:MAG: hypothetical protein JXR48_13110 [Candidatus Delongbacteria bacterium]|nr:hypothetical protein [Candidatus Delongbacteria bacterium]MBN2835893.1 hypothetical protein [Candidatus Delongbacteria bacterium]
MKYSLFLFFFIFFSCTKTLEFEDKRASTNSDITIQMKNGNKYSVKKMEYNFFPSKRVMKCLNRCDDDINALVIPYDSIKTITLENIELKYLYIAGIAIGSGGILYYINR